VLAEREKVGRYIAEAIVFVVWVFGIGLSGGDDCFEWKLDGSWKA
jgi:hypothetical protein